MKRITISILFLLMCVPLCAQSDFDLTQRWFNESAYNPAATGNTFTTAFFLQLRKQWAGLEGAPATEVIAANTYFEQIRSGVGISFTGDQIGFTGTYNARLSYAFYLPLTTRSALSLGLSAALLNRNRDANGALIDDLTDGELYYGNATEYSPDFDFGMEYQGAFKLGASIRHIGVQPSENNFQEASNNFWAYASTRFNVSATLSVEPTASYAHRDDINRYEAGAIFYFLKSQSGLRYNDRFWLGGMYRFNDQFAAMAGMHISPQLRIGYSFDYGFRELGILSRFGTHEIFISWQFNRLFYKDDVRECPAYKGSQYDTREKKKRMKDMYYQFY